MDADDNRNPFPETPEGLTPPIPVEDTTDFATLWRGEATLAQGGRQRMGVASVSFDTLPHPAFRFEVQAKSDGANAGGTSRLRGWFDPEILVEGKLSCPSPFGTLAVRPSNSVDAKISGIACGWATPPDRPFTSAKFLVINGPLARGTGIKRGRTWFVGRLRAAEAGGATVTVDRLFSEKQSHRSVFSFTHVGEIRFDEPQPYGQYEIIASDVFRTLSLMRGQWVGVVGPWLYVGDDLSAVLTQVTKTTENGSRPSWCHDTIPGIFEELFPCLHAALQDKERGESLQTGLHWLIESQQCAGGVEGSIILQQAALEALAWFVVVQNRKVCSTDGFEKLPASDKIRWLTSLYSINTMIPAHCAELVDYAKAYNLDDLPAILVDVRNALIHGSPKKVERLFSRQTGDNERSQLWYLIGGILEQAVLAVAGYRGEILRRDMDTALAAGAIKRVPWA